VAALLLERLGGRPTIQIFFCAAGAGMLLLLAPLPAALGLTLLCATRAAALGFNQSLWVVAAQTFPTPVRATGLGLVTCFARLAGIAAANSLAPLWGASRLAAIAVCAGGSALAAALVGFLPRRAAAAPAAGGEVLPADGGGGVAGAAAGSGREPDEAELQPRTPSPRTTPPLDASSPHQEEASAAIRPVDD